MAGLDDLLKHALAGLNSSFRAAEKDLSDLVGELSGALQRVVDQELKAGLRIETDNESGRLYGLSLVSKRYSSPTLITCFVVQSSGYPVLEGPPSNVLMTRIDPAMTRTLQDREQLEEFFKGLLSNQESALMVKLAFMLRRR